MPYYELEMAVVDEPEVHRKRKGDIVNCRESPTRWGWKTLDMMLHVPANTVEAGVHRALQTEHHGDGNIRGIDFCELHEDPEGELYMDMFGKGSVWAMKGRKIMLRPIKISKHRFNIIPAIYSGLDTDKLENKEVIFQPFLRRSDLIAQALSMTSACNYQFSEEAGRFYIQRIGKRVRKIYEEEINGKIIRFIRPKEPAIYVPMPGEPKREIICEDSGAGIGSDDKIEHDYDKIDVIIDKHTGRKKNPRQLMRMFE